MDNMKYMIDHFNQETLDIISYIGCMIKHRIDNSDFDLLTRK